MLVSKIEFSKVTSIYLNRSPFSASNCAFSSSDKSSRSTRIVYLHTIRLFLFGSCLLNHESDGNQKADEVD